MNFPLPGRTHVMNLGFWQPLRHLWPKLCQAQNHSANSVKHRMHIYHKHSLQVKKVELANRLAFSSHHFNRRMVHSAGQNQYRKTLRQAVCKSCMHVMRAGSFICCRTSCCDGKTKVYVQNFPAMFNMEPTWNNDHLTTRRAVIHFQ